MDISRVRMKFQKLWNFTVLTSYSINLNQAYYSLQQESLNSDDMLLYVTSTINPMLEGSLIEAYGQKWIVLVSMLEVVNKDLYEYKLFPATDIIVLQEFILQENALGSSAPSLGASYTIPCYLDEFTLKERSNPSAQPAEANVQSFIIAFNSIPDYKGHYVLTYKGLDYKIASFERDNGIVKIRAVENL